MQHSKKIKLFGGVKLLALALSFCFAAFAIFRFLPHAVSVDAFKNTVLIPTVVIDAGHGGFDGGAVSSYGHLEKDINLSISLKLDGILRLLGFKTVMTRTEDSALASTKKDDMYARLEIVNKTYDSVFVSIHQNHFSQPQYFGAQMFYGSKCEDESKRLASILKENFKQNINPNNTRDIKKAPSSLFLFKKAERPCVLVECGFLSNENEARLLSQDEYQLKIAFAIAQSICEYYNS